MKNNYIKTHEVFVIECNGHNYQVTYDLRQKEVWEILPFNDDNGIGSATDAEVINEFFKQFAFPEEGDIYYTIVKGNAEIIESVWDDISEELHPTPINIYRTLKDAINQLHHRREEFGDRIHVSGLQYCFDIELMD